MPQTTTTAFGSPAKRLREAIDDGINTEAKPLTVVVGEGTNAVTFYVHEDVVTKHSDFFAAALRNEWKESTERLVALPKDDPLHFRIFVRFLYDGKIHTMKEGDRNGDDSGDCEWPRFVHAWVLGDKLRSSSFQDAIVDSLAEKIVVEDRHPLILYKKAYSNTSGNNALRRLVVDISVFRWSKEALKKTQMGEWNELFRDLSIRMDEVSAEDRKRKAPFFTPSCDYHEHVRAGKPCYKTMFKY